MSRVKILDIPFDNLTQKELLQKVDKIVAKKDKKIIAFTNPEIVVQAAKNNQLRKYLQKKSHLNLADGIGVVWASQIFKKPLKERITGTDFVPAICKLSAEKNYRVFFLGGGKNTAQKGKKNLEKKYPKCQIVGTQNGYFPSKDDNKIVEKINKSRVQILMVCLGCPKQEKWILKNFDKLKVNLVFGNGGALDFWANNVKRAPKWMQKIGLEWLFRLAQDFGWRRAKRQFRLIIFVWRILLQKITNKF